jgi:DMSO/TMAO reductase YedYZ molybdopterin-dependent catalytic subunit
VGGLVAHPVSLSLAELRELGQQSQIVSHNCIQGWTAVAEWVGVPMSAVIDLVRPRAQGRHVVF